jgi:hypothetical protein
MKEKIQLFTAFYNVISDYSFFSTFSIVDRTMAQAVSRRLLFAENWVRAQSVNVGFVVDKVALRQDFLGVIRFSLVNIIPP